MGTITLPFNGEIRIRTNQDIKFASEKSKRTLFTSSSYKDLGIRTLCYDLTPNYVIDEEYWDNGVNIAMLAIYINDEKIYSKDECRELAHEALSNKQYGKCFIYKGYFSGYNAYIVCYPRFDSEGEGFINLFSFNQAIKLTDITEKTYYDGSGRKIS